MPTGQFFLNVGVGADGGTIHPSIRFLKNLPKVRLLIGPFGFATIKDANKNAGIIKRNPRGETAWDELIRGKVLERHHISGVPDGGLHVSEAPEIRHEVRSFLDNAALGPRLQRVLDAILKHS